MMKNLRLLTLFFLVFLIPSFVWECTGKIPEPPFIKGGVEYGKVEGSFRGRWWNYYERGLSFVEGKFYREALSDLEQSIKQREKDQRMARTYGMHFIDYFPHRESGVIHYQIGDLQAAKKELEKSLEHFPSAKGRFYLDLVRKSLIEKKGDAISFPTLTLDMKKDAFWTREDPVVISGVAEDEHYISEIIINNVPLFLKASQKRIPFKERLTLPQGRQVIQVSAKNLLGKITKRQIEIHVDREGPIISLGKVQFHQPGSRNEVMINASIFDEAGISEFTINDFSIPFENGTEFFLREKFTIKADSIILVARDSLGNQTTARIPLSSVSKARDPVLFACSNPALKMNLSAGLFGAKDTNPPIIKLKDWTKKHTVFLEKVYIECEILDDGIIESVTLGDAPVLRHKGQRVFFSHLAELREGENTVVIEARDEAGNVACKKITIIRRIPKALQLAERLSVTIFPFEKKGKISEASLAFQDNLINSLFKRNRFQVIERGELDMILQEQKLSRTKLIDKGTALKLGKLVASKSIVTGSIIDTHTGIEIVGKFIDTETSEILAVEDVYGEIEELPALSIMAEGMAVKFHKDFPLVGGNIIQQKDQCIITDLGENAISLKRRLIVYREEVVREAKTGTILGADNIILGRALVTQVMPKISKADLLNNTALSTIKDFDKVITE
jgi:tetratricopeptide (TPR) repeat protein/TolB-like protein